MSRVNKTPAYEHPDALRIVAWMAGQDFLPAEFIAPKVGLSGHRAGQLLRSLRNAGKLTTLVIKGKNFYRLPRPTNAIPSRDWAFMKPMSAATLASIARASFTRRPAQSLSTPKHL